MGGDEFDGPFSEPFARVQLDLFGADALSGSRMPGSGRGTGLGTGETIGVVRDFRNAITSASLRLSPGRRTKWRASQSYRWRKSETATEKKSNPSKTMLPLAP